MKRKIIVCGSGWVSCATRSNGALGSIAASSSLVVSRICGSNSATRRGVNARPVGARRRVCSGGSSETIEGWGLWPPSNRICVASGTSGTSGSCAGAAENASVSRKTRSTSAWRVTT